MLKINLLPAYYKQRKLVKRMAVLCVVAALATVGGFMYWNSTLQKQVAAAEEQIQKFTPDKQAADQYDQEAQGITGQIQPLKDKVKFCDEATLLPEKWCAILSNAAQYTEAGISLTSMVINGNTLTMEGHTPNMRMAARYLLNALRNPEWTSVSINGPAGYPGPGPGGGLHPRFGAVDYALHITATLANPVSVPSPSGTVTGAAGGQGGGPGGGSMGGPPGAPPMPMPNSTPGGPSGNSPSGNGP